MDYNQGHRLHGSSSLPQPSYYGGDPYSYAPTASSAPSYYYHQPPPPGTEHAAPPAHSSYSSSAETPCYATDRMNPAAASAPTQFTDFAASTMGASERAAGHQLYPPRYPPAQHPSAALLANPFWEWANELLLWKYADAAPERVD